MDNTSLSATSPAFVDLEMTYTRVSAVESLRDNVLMDAAGDRNFDQFSTIDALRRVVSRDEGELNSGKTAIDTGKHARLENMARTLLGRVYQNQINLDAKANSNYTSGTLASKHGGEMDDTRTINKRNELCARSVYDKDNTGSPAAIALSYDKNGNLTDDGELYTYKYDAWNRLVQVKKRLTPFEVVANYTYNALGQRISEQYDCNDSGNTGVTDGVTDSYDPVFFIALDRAGRRVATFRGTDTNPKETFIYHASGSSSGNGPNFTGGVLLRDRDSACATPTNWATTSASATRSERYFYFADSRGSIMALVSATGVLAEQYRYSPTGVPFGIPGGDMDADGTVQGGSGQTDENIVKVTGTYEVRKDLNLDGVVDAADQAIVNAADGRSTGRGVLSASSTRMLLGNYGAELCAGDSIAIKPSGRVFHVKQGFEMNPGEPESPPIPSPIAISCVGCIACMIAVEASCGILCGTEPWWDTPGEGLGMCMAKCTLESLGMPLSIIPALQGNQPIDPAHIAMTACEFACGGCAKKVASWLTGKIRSWIGIPEPPIIRPKRPFIDAVPDYPVRVSSSFDLAF